MKVINLLLCFLGGFVCVTFILFEVSFFSLAHG